MKGVPGEAADPFGVLSGDRLPHDDRCFDRTAPIMVAPRTRRCGRWRCRRLGIPTKRRRLAPWASRDGDDQGTVDVPDPMPPLTRGKTGPGGTTLGRPDAGRRWYASH